MKTEYTSNKASHRTMGQAKVPAPTTDSFLKKHSKEPKLPDSKLTFSCFEFTISKRLILVFIFPDRQTVNSVNVKKYLYALD